MPCAECGGAAANLANGKPGWVISHNGGCKNKDYERMSFLRIRKMEYMHLLDNDPQTSSRLAYQDWLDMEQTGEAPKNLREERDQLHAKGVLTYSPPPGRGPNQRKKAEPDVDPFADAMGGMK